MRRNLSLGLLLTIAFVGSARAQDQPIIGLGVLPPGLITGVEDIFDEVTDGLQVRLGLGLALTPSFEGDDGYNLRFFPRLTVRWRDRVVLSNTRLEVVAWKSKTIAIGPLVQFRFGRDENDDPELAGMGNISNALEVGGFVQWRPGWFVLGADVSGDVGGGHDGVLGSFWVGTEVPLAERWSMSLGARVSWVSGAYMRANFGITPEQNALTDLPVFSASGGFKDAGVRLRVRYKALESWRVSASMGYARLLGDAAASPLVQERGSPN
ncbi:MAG: MipA/OmpV family protein [Proteobacteria bacterium]|nr:MipA/OmpV family protein [Pseudomonadota bacterium]